MNHYFSENPEIKSQKRLIKYTIEAEKFELTTDNGVFSKAKVDFGTDLMLKTFIKLNKNSKYIVVENAGHISNLDNAKFVNKIFSEIFKL